MLTANTPPQSYSNGSAVIGMPLKMAILRDNGHSAGASSRHYAVATKSFQVASDVGLDTLRPDGMIICHTGGHSWQRLK